MARLQEWRLEEARQANRALPEEERQRIAKLDDEVNMGNLDTVRALIEAGMDVNCWNSLGDTPLIVAAHTGQADMVRLLLLLGADTELQGCDGLTALQRAQELDHREVIEAFMNRA